MYVCIRVGASDSQRRQSLSSIEVKKLQQADSARRKSLTAVQTTGSDKAERRESRSERHKRVCTNIQTDYTLYMFVYKSVQNLSVMCSIKKLDVFKGSFINSKILLVFETAEL